MHQLTQTLRALPHDLDIHAPEPAALSGVSDRDLVRAVGLAIARPKHDRMSSFILHAPLELLARGALLPLVQPQQRSASRMRIARIAPLYAEGDELDPPVRIFPNAGHAQSALGSALIEGDPDTADAAMTFLAERLSCDALCVGLVDLVAPCLGAAAHAPLLLAALGDATTTFGNLSILLRAPMRMLASRPDLRLSWIDQATEGDGPEDFWEALARPPQIVMPNDSIAPMMLAVEANGLAARLLARATARSGHEAARTLARLAARSMIEDVQCHVPYGWTHCLTLPQGLMALERYSADPERLARIAATFVLGFRATLGLARLEPCGLPSPSSPISALAGYAATHEDAHLAKYVVACLKAAAADPPAGSLFGKAAHHLANWWRERPIS